MLFLMPMVNSQMHSAYKMIAPTATTLRRLASLSLTFSVLPIEDPSVLQARADHFSNLVTWSTIAVAVGIALEGVEIIHDVIVWIKRKGREKRERIEFKEVSEIFPAGEMMGETASHSAQPRWVKRLLRLGLIIVVIGVTGEWRYGAKLEDAQKAIHRFDINLLTAAQIDAGDAKTSALIAKGAADAAVKEVNALAPRNLNLEQQKEIAKVLKEFRGHPAVVGSYGMDGEGTALAWQLIVVLHEGTGLPVVDRRANTIVSDGFEWGVAIRGPESEMPFMSALDKALTSIGKLDRVSINGLEPSTGAVLGGRAVMGGHAVMGGGGGPPHRPTIPANGPVSVMVGIRPPPLLPRVGK